jgi:hypothetical protein
MSENIGVEPAQSQERPMKPMIPSSCAARAALANKNAVNLKQLFLTVSAVLFILEDGVVHAGEPINDSGAMACVTDKWDEKEPEKGHKLVDSAMRCVLIPDDPAEKAITQDCMGKYEYMPDGSWKGTGTCTDNYPGGDKISLTWEEGSHLKEYTYTKTSGTGKYQGVKGGGTYMYESLTDTLSGGRYKGHLVLP